MTETPDEKELWSRNFDRCRSDLRNGWDNLHFISRIWGCLPHKFDQNRSKFDILINTFARFWSDFTKSAACTHVFATNMCKFAWNQAKFVVLRVCNKYVQICLKSGEICCSFCCCSRNVRYGEHFCPISVRFYKIGRMWTRVCNKYVQIWPKSG